MKRPSHPARAAALMALLALATVGGASQSAQPRVRLIVIVVVDQMRNDYVNQFRHRWRGGMRVLLEEGAYFTEAAYPYLNPVTCAGHATIGTGALPRTHGMVLNTWWDPAQGAVRTCVDDPGQPTVSYGQPSRGGISARKLLVPTLGDELRAQRPGARVVSLSLKHRSAVPLAGHQADVVTWFDEIARSFVTSRAFAQEPVPAVRRFIERNPFERDVDQVWSLREAPASYRFPDASPGERPKAGWTALFPHPLSGRTGPGIEADFVDRWQKSPFSDAYLARMAAALVDELELGRRGTTDYLALSFSALDVMAHDFGPDTREVEDMLMRFDTTLGELIERLDASIGRDAYVLALTADHGVAPVPETQSAGRIANEDIQHLVEQTLTTHWGPPRVSAEAPPPRRYVGGVTTGHVFFAAGIYERLQRDLPTLRAVESALLSLPGVSRVLRGSALLESAGDDVLQAAALGYVSGRSGDLIVVPRRNWIVELRSEGDATSHGSPYDYDTRVPVLLAGGAIKPGRYAGRATPADIAPTLAHVAGVTLAKADGRILREAIR